MRHNGMIIISITLHNFMSHADATLDLTSVPVACLSGNNGAGKSAILDAVTWAPWESRGHPPTNFMRIGERMLGRHHFPARKSHLPSAAAAHQRRRQIGRKDYVQRYARVSDTGTELKTVLANEGSNGSNGHGNGHGNGQGTGSVLSSAKVPS